MWDQEVKEYFLGKCLFKNTKHSRKFKRLSFQISVIPDEVKEAIIREFLQMKAHENAAVFFKYYGRKHPEFDSREQYEKREVLVKQICRNLYEGVKEEGLEDTNNINLSSSNIKHASSDSKSPRSKKVAPISLTKVKSKNWFKNSEKNKSKVINIKATDKPVIPVETPVEDQSEGTLPGYEYKPDKLSLRKMIMRGLKY